MPFNGVFLGNIAGGVDLLPNPKDLFLGQKTLSCSWNTLIFAVVFLSVIVLYIYILDIIILE